VRVVAAVTLVLGLVPRANAWAQSSSPQPEQAPIEIEAPPSSSSPSPAPPAASTEPSEAPAPPAPTSGSLAFSTEDDGQEFTVTVDTSSGPMQCATTIRKDHPCTIADVPLGSARLRVRGSVVFERAIDVTPGETSVGLHHQPAANGVVPGLLLLAAGLACGGGSAAIIYACGVGTTCGNDAYDAFAVPLAILAPAFLIGGIGMLAWHRPEQTELLVTPAEPPPMARAPARSPIRIGFGAAPLPGGASVGVTGVF
jgi:hypothetical protein